MNLDFDINEMPPLMQTMAENMGEEFVQMIHFYYKLDLQDKKLTIAIVKAMLSADKYQTNTE